MGRDRVDPRACGHNVAVAEGEEGAKKARCLACGTVGPEHATSDEAVVTLWERGEGRRR